MNRKEFLKDLEHKLRECRNMMRHLYPNFNSVPNAERFMQGTFKANKALARLQDSDEGHFSGEWEYDEE
tara:strand:+ start:599 stop:805 length:207 start_codon:yes stop_codon:yes gene_type:complete